VGEDVSSPFTLTHPRGGQLREVRTARAADHRCQSEVTAVEVVYKHSN
jgi:hypothetical protein